MEIATVEPGDEFVAMGRLVALSYRRGRDVIDVAFEGDRPLLAEHQPTGDLFILDGPERRPPRRRHKHSSTKPARKRYEEINWGERAPEVGRVTIPRFDAGDEFVELGPLVCVTYESDKSGEPVHWFHEFEPELPTLAEHTASSNLAILGGSYQVTARGIVG